MATLKFRNINKIYDNKVQAVFDFNLDIDNEEFIVFVGPSGCGKSTTLRMVAGLEEISSGELYIDDVLVNDIAPKDREIAMVFQSYALYPHMTVYENMAFGLKLRKTSKDEIDRRVKEAAKILDIEEYLERKPKALSGGQRQRVALGRAIVRSPKVFLMDEPLSNLDAKLRVQMRTEITKIHKKVGATTIYVTHDQTEAMTMASRIVVMKDGYIQQIGTPKEIYTNPINTFVGGFIGSPAMNFIKGFVEKNRFIISKEKDISIEIPERFNECIKEYDGKELILGIRPEDLHVATKKTKSAHSLNVVSDIVELLGKELIVYGFLDDQRIVISTPVDDSIENEKELIINVNPAKMHFFDKDSTLNILFK